MRLYDFLPSGNGYKVRLILHQTETPFTWVNVDILDGATRAPAFLAKNPNGRIPLLELDDGRLLAESNAILYYLAQGTPLLPRDPYLAAQIMQWMFFEQYSHERFVAVARFICEFSAPGDPRHEELSGLRENGHAALRVMETHLSENRFFVGDTYSIADIALYAYTHVADEGGFDLSPYDNIRKWLSRVSRQDRHIPITKNDF